MFSKDLTKKLKTYFLNNLGIVLSDDKANSYLLTLGNFGLILAESKTDKKPASNTNPATGALLRERAQSCAARKAPVLEKKGTDLVSQCPRSAYNLNTSRRRSKK